jgi:2-keto-4-pentenoate hydratase/2-oxohepta-3-ene-1,7-dioic acid hydratase in catechol pathway
VRLARLAHPGGVAFAAIDGDIEDPESLTAREILDHPFGTPEFSGKTWPLADTRLLAPILPSKILGFGRNYADHARELGNAVPDSPLMFLKPSTSVVGPGAAIQLPRQSETVNFEGELAVVIGRPCRDVKADDASGVILGYTVANDVTARDLQKVDGQWSRAKGFDSFCPLGPWIETELDPYGLSIRTELDGELLQDGNTSDMILTIGEMIEWVSAAMTLLPGDVLLTGTPEGVAAMSAGQTVSIEVEGIGTLTNPVTDRG